MSPTIRFHWAVCHFCCTIRLGKWSRVHFFQSASTIFWTNSWRCSSEWLSLGRDHLVLWMSIDPAVGHWGTGTLHHPAMFVFVQSVFRWPSLKRLKPLSIHFATVRPRTRSPISFLRLLQTPSVLSISMPVSRSEVLRWQQSVAYRCQIEASRDSLSVIRIAVKPFGTFRHCNRVTGRHGLPNNWIPLQRLFRLFFSLLNPSIPNLERSK